ncbi:MAG TPA: DUF192 domain-containing protein [Candidatus Dormibacteraeota bacterium]|nr:DUF192 domain-containing protein [Candidatus Dormibacteraeota bacterium]
MADSSWKRFVGLMGRASLPAGEGLWIEPCNSIHMFFMRFAIDAVFLDRDNRVKRVVRDLKPWRVSPIVFGARTVVELPAGSVPPGIEGRRVVREG